MASNLSTIGFQFANNDEFSKKMIELAEATDGQAICAEGHYAVWREPSGAQLWFHIMPESSNGGSEPTELSILGLTPFFEGKSSVPLKITAPIRRDADNSFEGGFYAWVGSDADKAEATAASTDESGNGSNDDADFDDSYPMVFDAVDFAVHAKRQVPFTANVRLSGFARELKAYASPEAYAEVDGDGPKLAASAFIPMGIFAASAADGASGAANDNTDNGAVNGAKAGADGQGIAGTQPSATALLTGTVRAHHLLTNNNTGRDYHWLTVDSLAASFDILADPEVVSGEIVTGGVVEVACWFFGRILD